MNQTLCWINLFFLMFVSLLPFSAGLVGHLTVHPVTQFFYFGNQLILALLLLTHWLYARRKGLTDADLHPEQATMLTWRIASMAAAFAGGLVFTPFRSEGGSLGFGVVLVTMAIARKVFVKRRFRNRR